MLPRLGRERCFNKHFRGAGPSSTASAAIGKQKKATRQKRNNVSGALSVSTARARSPPKFLSRRATDARRVAKPLGAAMHVARVARDREFARRER